ncbi:MAG: PQQ-like beta-propeller repeat protein, partial [Candidatus Coatesbacteria bacterium]|nr:PQQ-like beta-propeller repeat protein [Candidatus Coatesbacteria bacterium]
MKITIIILILVIATSLFSLPGDLIWKFKTDDIISSSPRISNNTIFVGSSDKYIYAIDAVKGTLIWKCFLLSPVDRSSPCISDGVVYIGSGEYNDQSMNYYFFHAIDASNGSVIWKFKSGSIVSSPYISDSSVYFGSCDDFIYSLDKKDGRLNWRYKTNDDVTSSPLVSDNIIYIGSHDNNFYAINCSNGSLKWKYQTGNSIDTSPCFSNNVVFFASGDGYVYALNSSDGSLKWRYKAGYGGGINSSPCVSDGVVFIGGNDLMLYAINEDSGILKWRFMIEGPISDTPCYSDNIVYIGGYGTSHSVYSIKNADKGIFQWKYRTSGDIGWSSPSISDGVLFVGSTDTYLYAVQSSNMQIISPNGKEKWLCNTSHDIVWNSTDTDSIRIYYSTNDGKEWISINTFSDPAEGNGLYSWKIPWMQTTDQAKVQITNHMGNVSDTSDAVFTISEGELTVVYPNGGEKLYADSVYAIKWNATTNIDSVIIEYSTDNGSSFMEITQENASSGTYSWKVPNTPSTQCLVRITNTAFSKPTDKSDAVFEINSGTGFKDNKTASYFPIKEFSISPNPFSSRLSISLPS